MTSYGRAPCGRRNGLCSRPKSRVSLAAPAAAILADPLRSERQRTEGCSRRSRLRGSRSYALPGLAKRWRLIEGRARSPGAIRGAPVRARDVANGVIISPARTTSFRAQTPTQRDLANPGLGHGLVIGSTSVAPAALSSAAPRASDGHTQATAPAWAIPRSTDPQCPPPPSARLPAARSSRRAVFAISNSGSLRLLARDRRSIVGAGYFFRRRPGVVDYVFVIPPREIDRGVAQSGRRAGGRSSRAAWRSGSGGSGSSRYLRRKLVSVRPRRAIPDTRNWRSIFIPPVSRTARLSIATTGTLTALR